ncbi:hypothetical protein H4582DRAFT_348831 [Lactarius indigo]|nr:hypothetical protein H4582DRAFT_348831 [Lactarius indigo]
MAPTAYIAGASLQFITNQRENTALGLPLGFVFFFLTLLSRSEEAPTVLLVRECQVRVIFLLPFHVLSFVLYFLSATSSISIFMPTRSSSISRTLTIRVTGNRLIIFFVYYTKKASTLLSTANGMTRPKG